MIILLFVLWLRLTFDISFILLTRDVAAVADLPFYVGFLSQIGLILWSVAAGVSYFMFSVRQIGMFLWTGILSTLLLLDDIFQFHEVIVPFVLGIPEIGVFFVYGMMFVLFIWRYRSALMRSPFFLAAIGFGGFSVLFDLWIRRFHSGNPVKFLLFIPGLGGHIREQ